MAFRRIFTGILAFLLVITMTGCKDTKEPPASDEPEIVDIKIDNDELIQYIQTKKSQISDCDEIRFISRRGDFAYFLGSKSNFDGESFSSNNYIITYNTGEGILGEQHEIANNNDGTINSVAMNSDGDFWALARPNSFGTMEAQAPRLLKLNRRGEVLESWDCGFVKDTYSAKEVYTVEDYLVLRYQSIEDSSDILRLISLSEGEPLNSKPVSEFEVPTNDRTLTVNSETVLTYSSYNGVTHINEYNLADGSLTSTAQLTIGAAECYDGLDGKIYISDGINLYKWVRQYDTLDAILKWTDSGILNCEGLLDLEGDSFLICSADGTAFLATLSPGARDYTTTVTLATTTTIYNGTVTEFNAMQDEIKVEILHYPNNEGDDPVGAIVLDIMSGKTPDILDISSFRDFHFKESDLLMDMNTFIQNSNIKFADNVLQAFETDGSLYKIPIVYNIITLSSNLSELGTGDELTFDKIHELEEIYNTGMPFGAGYTKDDFLDLMLYVYSGALLDWDNKACNFDSPLFQWILERSNEFPDADSDWNEFQAIRENKQLLSFAYISRMESIRLLRAFYGGYDFSILGFPGLPSSALIVTSNYQMGITNSSDNKDSAWKFIEYLTSSNITAFGLPINQTAMERLIAEAIDKEAKLREEGSLYRVYARGEEVDVAYMPETDFQMLRSLISDSQFIASKRDTRLNDIIYDEVEAYFAGQKDLEETVRLIQSRAQLVMNEQS